MEKLKELLIARKELLAEYKKEKQQRYAKYREEQDAAHTDLKSKLKVIDKQIEGQKIYKANSQAKTVKKFMARKPPRQLSHLGDKNRTTTVKNYVRDAFLKE